jgi:hypothetical protein
MNNEQVSILDVFNILSYLLQTENIKRDDKFLIYIQNEIEKLHMENKKIINLLEEIKGGKY